MQQEAPKSPSNLRHSGVVSSFASIREVSMAGNPCLFYTFVLFNSLNILVALGVLGVAVYLIITTGVFDVFSITFMASSGVLLLFSIAALKMRKAVNWLCVYLIILFLFMVGFLLLNILFFLDVDKLVDLAIDAYLDKFKVSRAEAEKIIKSHYRIVGYSQLCFMAIIVSKQPIK